MPVRTAAALFTRVRAIADMQDDDSNGFVSDATLLAWLNQARYQLDLIFARSSYVIGINRTTVAVTGASVYNIPAPIAIAAIDWVTPDGKSLKRIRPIHMAQNYPILANRQTTSSNPNGYYGEVKSDGTVDIYFDLTPTAGSFVVSVIPYPTDLALVSDTVNYPGGHDEWLVLELARNCVIKEEGDTRALDARQKKIENHIESEGWSRQFMDVPGWRSRQDESTYDGETYKWLFI